MPRLRDSWGLPLLMKELVELSGKWQTYAQRVSYAAMVFLIALAAWSVNGPKNSNAIVAVLTIGPIVGSGIYYTQAVGIQWLWPIMASSTFAAEKERNTLPLLLLTKLSPTTIVLEKFCSRLLLVATFLCLSLPILAFCLGIGGISSSDLLTLCLSLVGQTLEITAISLMCSAYCRTTPGALIATYVVAVLIKATVGAIWLHVSTTFTYASFYEVMVGTLYLQPPFNLSTWRLSGILGPGTGSLSEQLVPSLIVSGLCLLLSRRFLITRTFLSNTDTSLKSFVDRVGYWANRLNQNAITRGTILIREGRREPDFDPVTWRETTTRALGQPRYLIGNFLALEFPIIWFLIIVVVRLQGHELLETIATMQMYLWIGMSLMIANVVSGMINQERQKQTWETLLVTPLTNRDIVQQKMDGIQRMLWILQAPLWTCMVFRAYHEGTVSYVLNESSMLLLYPRLVAWIAMTCGVIYKNRIQAILMTIVTCFGWCLLGCIVAAALLLPASMIPDPPTIPSVAYISKLMILKLMIMQICPLALLLADLTPEDFGTIPIGQESLLHGIWNFALYYVMLRLLRQHCLTVTDRRLRSETP
jgi:ABC-type Na+ efflux pump permease subunit